MQIGVIKGCTRVLGKSQGYKGLPVREETVNCRVNGPGTPSMTTAWLPTPKEIEALNAGAAVHVQLLTERHPPILVTVGEVPEDAAARGPAVPK